jgi:uncharacterized protein (DUF2132 family)
MDNIKSKNPLHGITLEKIVTDLQAKYGWARLGEEINIKCFTNNPSLKSSLVFLRRTPWARAKVEKLYLFSLKKKLPERKNIFKKIPVRNIPRADKELWPDMKL